MAKTPKSSSDQPGDRGSIHGKAFKLPSNEELQAMFGEDDEEGEMSPAELASATLSTIPMPLLAMIGADERLAAMMVAFDPELSLADVSEALENYEDLLISVLAEVRNQRRELTNGAGSDNPDARASTIHGRAAVELLDSFLETSDDDALLLPGIDTQDLRENLKTLKDRG